MHTAPRLATPDHPLDDGSANTSTGAFWPLKALLTAPVIYSVFIPLGLLHAWIWAYERICFPALGIPLVAWKPYVVVDRHRLPYLNLPQRLNCGFCAYANGLFAYVREVAARTEAYWCPIRHKRAVRDPHRLYRNFARYGDVTGFRHYLSTHPLDGRAVRRPRRPLW